MTDAHEMEKTTVKRASISRILTRDPVIWFMIVAFSIVAFLFYNTEFRDVLENWFFDVRMNWAPQQNTVDDIVVVAIDDSAIDVLDASQPRLHFDRRKRPYLSIESLTRVAGILANSEAKAIAFLMPNHAFPHNDPRIAEFIEIVRFDQRMIIGTMEYNRADPGVSQIPYPLASIDYRVFGYETFRRRSNVIVRKLPFTGYRGLNEELMLPPKLTAMVTGNFGDLSDFYILNHLKPDSFTSVSAGLAETDPKKLQSALKSKIAIIGYTVSRDIPFQTTDMMLVNTPLIGDEENLDQGKSTTYLVANAVENLVHKRQLTPANPVFNFAQTIAMATICAVIWELGSFSASIITVAIWLLLIASHAFIFSYVNYIVPLADTFLASALVSIFAAVRRLRLELQDLAVKQAAADSKSEIARIHAHFLDDFATWLQSVTRTIVAKVREAQADAIRVSPANSELYRRTFVAGEDFEQYLESIRQIPALENMSHRPTRQKINLEPFIDKVVRRFQLKILEKSLVTQITVDPAAAKLSANESLLDSIIFNFISNAVKYSPPGGKIVIHAKSLNRKFLLSITDQGPGISSKMKERIFEKFYRIQDETLYQGSGSGLGLYLCRFFADRMGGKVWVESTEGHGSTFLVQLP
ncbi:MAG: ATP-binding protein [Proteobacteria bacterium]|nr:ATP-binding protein [Pseudomonadota bacterium]